MKQKEITLNTLHKNDNIVLSEMSADEIGNEHMSTSIETPMKKDAFVMSDEEKIKKIESHFKEIMEALGLDLNDDSLKGTPNRVAKMYIKEIFSGLDPANKPEAKLFENKYQYNHYWKGKNTVNSRNFSTFLFVFYRSSQHKISHVNQQCNSSTVLLRIVAPSLAPSKLCPYHSGNNA